MVSVKVLGTGCAKCDKLYERTLQAVRGSGVEADVAKIEGLDEIVDYGVFMTPALVIEGEVKCTGRLPSVADVTGWLAAAAARRG